MVSPNLTVVIAPASLERGGIPFGFSFAVRVVNKYTLGRRDASGDILEEVVGESFVDFAFSLWAKRETWEQGLVT